MKRLLSVITKQSFFHVTTFMACRSYDTLSSGLKNTRFIQMAYQCQKTKCSYYFLVTKSPLFAFLKHINFILCNDSIQCFRNTLFWRFRNGTFGVSETPFLAFQKHHFWRFRNSNFGISETPSMAFHKHQNVKEENTIYQCLVNAKKIVFEAHSYC